MKMPITNRCNSMLVLWKFSGRSTPGREHGFTLIELLVVLAILGLLVGLVAPRVLNQLGGARSDTAQIQMKNIESALDLFRLDMGRYPTTDEGLTALIRKPASADRWRGPYIRKREGIVDPWGQTYRYRVPGRNGAYDLFSYGSDNVEGGDGENQDHFN